MTILYWSALYLISSKACTDLGAFDKGTLRRDLMVFAIIFTLGSLLAALVVLGSGGTGF